MDHTYFRINYNGKEIDFDIASSELQLWKADNFDNKIGLFINVQTQGKEIDFFDAEEQEMYQHYLSPRIYTEWLDIPIDYIKNKDFRTLESVKIDFKDSGTMDEIERLVWTESPGALYVDNHGVFEHVNIEFNYLGQGRFNVKLKGTAEFDTPFDVSSNISLELELKAYDNRATKEDILTFFNKIVDSTEFNYEWRYREEDIFFKASPKV